MENIVILLYLYLQVKIGGKNQMICYFDERNNIEFCNILLREKMSLVEIKNFYLDQYKNVKFYYYYFIYRLDYINVVGGLI